MQSPQDSWASFFQKALIGVAAWLGALSVETFSHLMAGISYAAGAIWFATQTYLAWRNKQRKD